MRAVYYNQWGGPDVLSFGELAKPEPRSDEVLIRLHATSVNPIDWKIRDGLFECVFDYQFPIIPGWDAAGEIAEVGDQVRNWSVGERVYAYCRRSTAHEGTYADYIRMPASAIAVMPETLTFEEAAAVPLCALTCWQSLNEFGRLAEGQTVLVHAGAGGVGSFAIQMAKLTGARVLTTTSRRNFEYVYDLGADIAIDYRSEDWRDRVESDFPDGVDMVFDCVGGPLANESIGVVRRGGALACLNDPPDQATVHASGIRATRIFAEPNGEQLTKITHMINGGALRLPTIEVLDLSQAGEAMERSKDGHVRGKLVLKIT